MEKRGLEMVMTTIIMVILSIGVLTLLIVFLNSQTGFLSNFFKTQSSQSNVDVVVSACNGLVNSESAYSYCCEKKEITFENGSSEMKTCLDSKDANWASGRIRSLDCSGINCAG